MKKASQPGHGNDSTAQPVAEFPDWLGPVCVCELRRSLRAPFFIAGFVILHVCALLAALVDSGLSILLSGAKVSGFSGGVLATVSFLAFVFVLPLGQFRSLQCELGPGRNAELLVTSRLGLREIVGGRILVATGFAATLLVSMLPYSLLRYFLGGVELVDLLIETVRLFLANATMNAIVIGASVFGNVVGRTFLIAAIGILYFSIKTSYLIGTTGLIGISVPGSVWFGELLAAALFIMVGMQLALEKLANLEKPHVIGEAGPIIVLIFLVIPFAHGLAYILGGAIGGLAALALMIALVESLHPLLPRKKQLKPAAPRPPLPSA